MNVTPKNKSWFEFKNQSESSVDLYIYDEIGYWGVTAKDFIFALKEVRGKHINLRINSPGGEVFEGSAIFNALRRYADGITVYIDGIAASMASAIAMVGDPVVIADNAFLMIHDPSVFAHGSSDNLRKGADLLDSIKTNLVRMYATKTGIEQEKIAEMMSEETWLDAREAVALGFADAIGEGIEAAAMNMEKAHAIFDTFKKSIMAEETNKTESETTAPMPPESNPQPPADKSETTVPENNFDVSTLVDRLTAMGKERDDALARATKAEADISRLNETLQRLEKSKGLAPADEVLDVHRDSEKKTLTMEEFRALNPREKSDFFKQGGKLTD